MPKIGTIEDSIDVNQAPTAETDAPTDEAIARSATTRRRAKGRKRSARATVQGDEESEHPDFAIFWGYAREFR